jgi:hypothetical protein
MRHPVIHLNGTSREALMEQYLDARNAVEEAIVALGKAGPNPRDYYPVAGTFGEAAIEHSARVNALRVVSKQLYLIIEALDARAGL